MRFNIFRRNVSEIMKKRVIDIVLDGVNVINHNLDNRLPVNLLEQCPLYGSVNGIDSMSLVALIGIVEDSLENQLDVSIIIANEKAMSRKNSPFLTVGTLVDYICDLIQSKPNVEDTAL